MRTVIQLAMSSIGDPVFCCRDSIAEMMMRSALHKNTMSRCRLAHSPSCYLLSWHGDNLADDNCAVGSGGQPHRSLYWCVNCVAVAPDRADDAPQERMQPPPFSSVSASPSGLRTAMTMLRRYDPGSVEDTSLCLDCRTGTKTVACVGPLCSRCNLEHYTYHSDLAASADTHALRSSNTARVRGGQGKDYTCCC